VAVTFVVVIVVTVAAAAAHLVRIAHAVMRRLVLSLLRGGSRRGSICYDARPSPVRRRMKR
jgi:hypothetical protein